MSKFKRQRGCFIQIICLDQLNDNAVMLNVTIFFSQKGEFMDGLVPSVTQVTSQPRLGQVQRRINDMCGYKS